MKPSDLTAQQLKEIARQHAEINEILRQKHETEVKLREVMCEAEALRNLMEILDTDLRRACLKAAPTEILSSAHQKSRKQQEIDDILKQIKKLDPSTIAGIKRQYRR